MTTAVVQPTGAGVGRVTDVADAESRYVEHLTQAPHTRLEGLRFVLDCAQGAASLAAPDAFRALGADVVAIHNTPNGLDINDGCGSTHLDSLREAVIEAGADAGFAFDGDADRCLGVDKSGRPVDGDHLLAILALALHEDGSLAQDTVVATVMSNLGFLNAMRSNGVEVVQAKVGDRYVLEEMRAGGYNLGGEQSGHVIMSEYATTGDGVLAALFVAARMAETGSSLAELAAVMERLPQVLVNVAHVDRRRVDSDVELQAAVAEAEAELGANGRVLLRPSGTEPLVRVMVEAESQPMADEIAHRLADVVKARLTL